MKPYYDEGGITIYHGDAMSVMPTLTEGSVQLTVTDPPYFQPAAHYVEPRGESPKRSIGDLSILEFAFSSWCDEIGRITSPTGSIYFFCDGQSYPLAFTALYPHSKRVRPLVWDKVTSYNGYGWRHQHELVAWAERPKAERIPTGDGDILRHRAVPVGDRVHPAEKPLGLLGQLVAKHPAATILDPFMGSGTTLEAARQHGHCAIGIEIEERYCEIAVQRLGQEVFDLEAA